MLNSLFDLLFKDILSSIGQFWFVFLLSYIISLFITLIYKNLTDQKTIKRTRFEIARLQKQLKEAKGDKIKTDLLSNMITEKNIKITMSSLLPNMLPIIPIMFIFGWFNVNMKGWLLEYFICAIVFSMLNRKLLDVY